ncbi:DUF5071 domain-containing protein [Peribacillus acanthi]|uniref:DUF5071 domain-containing protein n=1 Tax=Peribacillus acanthi TaxID=2171554 RepID=UPI000D3EC6B4|nr:DUF5071 domain-containing protein [Peribacillus acanthi]
MKSYKDLIPRNKNDFNRVEKIKKLDRNNILPLLPDLLVFIQDMNWPVAPAILEILLTFPTEIVPHVQDVLSTDDDNWKWFILHFLIIELPVESKVHFKEYLTRVAEKPTENELAEELNEIAKEILKTI